MRYWSQGKKLQLERMDKSRDLYSIMTLLNNPVLNTGPSRYRRTYAQKGNYVSGDLNQLDCSVCVKHTVCV